MLMRVNAAPTYRRDIDGLRGLAVLLVVAYHAFPTFLTGGFVGVDVFFVISGYLISTIVFTGLEGGGFSFVDFYARRIRRIFPALILVLFATYVLGYLLLLGPELKELGKHVAAGAAFVSNFVLWREAGYFDVSAELKPLLHLWSLGIEEQFYLFWPVLLWFSRRRKWPFLAVTTATIIISFAISVSLIGPRPVMTFYMPFTRLWELAAGALIARWDMHRGEDVARSSGALSVAGLVLIVGSAVFLGHDTAFPGYWAVPPVLGTCLLIPSGQSATWLNRALSCSGIVWIGLISYPLYLWHWPLLSLARVVASKTPPLPVRLGAIALATVLASLTYVWLEKPLKKRLRRSVLFSVFPLLLLSVGATGWVTYERDGVPLRANVTRTSFPGDASPVAAPSDLGTAPVRSRALSAVEEGKREQQGPDVPVAVEATAAEPGKNTAVTETVPIVASADSRQATAGGAEVRSDTHTADPQQTSGDRREGSEPTAADATSPSDWTLDDEFREVSFQNVDECRKRYPFAQYCGLSSTSRAPSVMVIGDSHSRAYFTALRSYFERRGKAVVWFGVGGCPPFLGVVRPFGDKTIDCNKVASDATDLLSRSPGIDTVILAAAFSEYTAVLRGNAGESNDEGIDLFRRGLDEVITRVERSGRRVILLHQVPVLGFDPKLCRSRPLRPATVTPCREQRDLSVRTFASYKKAVSDVLAAHPQTKEVDPMDVFCDSAICHAESGGHVLYFDNNHLNVFGSWFFGMEADRRNAFE